MGLAYKWVRIQMGTMQIGTIYVYVIQIGTIYVYVIQIGTIYVYVYLYIYMNIHMYYDEGAWERLRKLGVGSSFS